MKLSLIETGNIMLDGGAMFGVVPKSLWSKVYPADSNNLCNLSLRCLLIEEEDRVILVNAGIGNKQDEKFLRHYYPNGKDTLEGSLAKAGYSKHDITDVIFTHLHFDHCGGGTEFNENRDGYRLAFPKAVYHVSKRQWEWMLNANRRERASYLKENTEPLKKSGKLELFGENYSPLPGITFRLYDGHSQGMAIPIIRYNGRTLVYVSDFLPTKAHIPLSWICGFDTQPLVSLKEHEVFLEEAYKNDYILIFEHDIQTEYCRIEMTEKGLRGIDVGFPTPGN
jgi:glyoxylase-like metal-dependent hydrolase (beta-lactamase superfamily II)